MRNRRSETVNILDKEFEVKERTVGDLTELFSGMTVEADKVIGVDKAQDLGGIMQNFIGTKLTEVFPFLTEADIKELYPSEIEELVGAFWKVNFIGLTRVGKPLLNLFLQGLAGPRQK